MAQKVPCNLALPLSLSSSIISLSLTPLLQHCLLPDTVTHQTHSAQNHSCRRTLPLLVPGPGPLFSQISKWPCPIRNQLHHHLLTTAFQTGWSTLACFHFPCRQVYSVSPLVCYLFPAPRTVRGPQQGLNKHILNERIFEMAREVIRRYLSQIVLVKEKVCYNEKLCQ